MESDFLKHHSNQLGILICGHGSRNRLAVQEFAELAKELSGKFNPIPVEFGYLEFAKPTLKQCLDRLRQRSVDRVIAIPAMLTAAGHTKNDIPSLLNTYSRDNDIRIEYGRELGIDRLIIATAAERIKSCISQYPAIPLSQTMLVVVGRGSSDPDANSNISKVTRMLVEAFGFGWGGTVYSGVTFPLVEPGLRHLVKLGFTRVIVFPYFLFSGVLVSRIRKNTQLVASDYPEVEFLSAKYLGNHSFIVQAFIERINEVLEGEVAMNCSLCKYRDKLVGFESEAGLPQTSHHHHVEGLVEGCTLCTDECTGKCEEAGQMIPLSCHDHDHDHAHFPYPNSDHPLGPSSQRFELDKQ